MSDITQLMQRHAALKERVDAKEAAKKERESAFKTALGAELKAEFGEPEEDLKAVRDQLFKLAEAAPDRLIENEVGKVTLYERSAGFDVVDPVDMANWLIAQKRADVIQFGKSDLNKILNGLMAANLQLPGQAVPLKTEVLEVRLARPEAV